MLRHGLPVVPAGVRRFFCGALVLVLAGLPGFGQAGAMTDFAQQYVIRSWGTDAGLPQNSVNAIAQTPEGYLWLATQGGLARFDGVRFKVFGLEEGLPSVSVRALLVDRAGELWIGTGGGLCRWRGGRFEKFTSRDGLAADSISSLALDGNGRLWVGTILGVSIFTNERFVDEPALEALGRVSIRTLVADGKGGMIISAVVGLFRVAEGRLEELPRPAELPDVSPYCLLVDRAGRLWAGIGNGRVLCREREEWKVYDMTSGLPFAYIGVLAEDGDGTLWAGSVDAGLYGLREGRFLPVHRSDGLSAEDIRSLFVDDEGHLWVGTRTGGLNRMARRKVEVFGSAQGLTNEFVRAVAETPDGSWWVATSGAGLQRRAGAEFVPWEDTNNTQFTFLNTVLATHDGHLWVGGAGCLFQLLDGKLIGAWKRAQVSWLANAGVTALLEDEREGIWVGTSSGKVLRLRGGEFESFGGDAARGAVTALAQTEDGALWIGSTTGGLLQMRPGSGSTYLFEEILPGRDIRALHTDGQDTVWIGLAGGGLARWRAGRLAFITRREGLADDTISQILDDGQGHLWLGSNRGLMRVRRAELDALAEGRLKFIHPRVFGVADGLLAEEFATGSSPTATRLQSGELLFPTVRGVVRIDPRQPLRAAPVPRVMIEELMVGGTPHPGFPPQGVRGGDKPPVVVVPPGRRDVEITYTGLSYAAPARMRFRYRLGADAEWVEAGTRRSAYYQQLRPGRYEFQVLAANADNQWTLTPAAVILDLRPYYWETLWFAVMVGLLILGAAAGGVRLAERRRFRRRLASLETRNAVERERLRISRDMHDNVGSMLTQVSQMSDLAQSAEDHETLRQRLGRIGDQARVAVQALDEVVWTTNPQNDNLANFAHYVSRYADDFFEAAGLRCWQEIPPDLPAWPLPADARHNLFLAVKEAFNNIVKHAHATEVWLRLRWSRDHLTIEIEDNGRGFDPAALQADAGNGLRNLAARLAQEQGRAEITSQPGHGTRVRLVLPIAEAEPSAP
jgi:ligand-binding sensor domain-containing protein/signal transduction histidine kinase